MIQELLVSCYGSPNTTAKCVVEGLVVCEETDPKRIAVFARNDKLLRILSMTQSLPDKSWVLYVGETVPVPDTELLLIGIDDTGVYHPYSYDRVSVDTKIFYYDLSHLKNVEGQNYLLNETLLGLDRTIATSFINWLFDVNYQDSNDNMCLTNYIVPVNWGLTGIKSVIFEIESNWGYSSIGVRRIEFYDDTNTLIPLIPTTDYLAYGNQASTSNTPAMAFNTALSKTGSWTNNQWLHSTVTKQRLIIVFTNVKNISRIVYNASHNGGLNPTSGIRNVSIFASTTAGGYTTTTWEAAITDCIPIAVTTFPQHKPADIADDYSFSKRDYFSTNLMTGVKSVVIDAFTNWGHSTYMGLRRMEFFDTNGQRIPILSTGITTFSTGYLDASHTPNMAFITAASKLGSWTSTSWSSGSLFRTRQRIICVFTTVKNIKYIAITNGHNGDAIYPPIGIKDVKITFTTATLTANDAVFNLPVPSPIVVYDGIIPIHKPSNDYDYFYIKPVTPVQITDMSNMVIDPTTINLENGQYINTNDNKSFVVSGLSGNTFNTTPVLNNEYNSVIKSITSFFYNTVGMLKYTGTVNTSSVNTGSVIPVVLNDSLSSIQVDEVRSVIGFTPPVPDYGELCIQGGNPDGSIVFTDKSRSKIPMVANETKHSSTQYKFSPTSIEFTTIGCYLRFVNDGTFNLAVRDFTFTFWIWKSSYSSNNYYFVMGGCVLRNNGGNILLHVPTTSTTVLTVAAPTTNAWHLITLTRTTGVFKLYIDRVLRATSSATYNANLFGISGSSVTIGNDGSGAYPLAGYMEEFRFLMRSLSQEEITALPDARQTEYVDVQESGTTTTSVYYSISFDGENTYKVWTGTVWREIASCVPDVHGNVGDNDWYFRDNASVWSKTGVTNSVTAISKAVAYTNNQMTKTQLNALTVTEYSSTGGFVSSVGTVGIGIGFISTNNGVGATIKSIDINGNTNNLWLKKIPVNIATEITSSSISWNYIVSEGFTFDSSVVVSTLLTGQTSWSTCSNGGEVVGLTQGLTAENKELFVRVVAPKLSGSATFDPALFTLNVTVR